MATNMHQYQYLFFDLDGTLVQSEFGIIDSVIYALDKFGIRENDRQKLKQFIGPALFESFQRFYGFDGKEADQAVVWYREAYEREGIYHAPVYEGVMEMLERLRQDGFRLLVITAKPQEMAEKVLAHTGLIQYFEAVAGPDRSDRHTDKAALIRRALGMLSRSENRSAEELAAGVLMIGDRSYDIDGANEAGVDSAGVLYGYGTEEELRGAGATYVVQTPGGLADLVGRM